MPATQDEGLLTTLKDVAAALREADIPFALAGGLAAWARGGPPTEKDIDLLIRKADGERAHEVLAAIDLRPDVPPEDWLIKAYTDDGTLVDLIFRPSGFVVDDELLARCDDLMVHALHMRVMRADDILTSKLLSLTEHHLDYAPALEIARALREQVEWKDVWARTHTSPFARAFFALLTELDIVDGSQLLRVAG